MRTLDDIVPPSRRVPVQDMQPQRTAPGQPPMMPPRRPRARFPYMTALLALVVVAAAVIILFYFSSASVDVTPSSTPITASGSFTAAATGALPYQVISAQKTESQTVQSSGTTNVSTTAQGTITISNTQSTPQKLITNTRFAAATGLIYRIHGPVTVPAGGSVNATVYADKPGSTYNSGPTTFTVPGLLGDPQYTEVTAKTAGISGGASGPQPIVDAATESASISALKSALATDLASAIQAQVPEGDVLLTGATVTSYQDLPSTPSTTTGMVNLQEQGTITAIVFPNAALAAAIESSAGGSQTPGTIQDSSALSLSPVGTIPTDSSSSFSFSLTGSATVVSTIDQTRIASAVAGKTREAAQVALTNFPEVKQAILILRPFWRNTFPQDPASIKVIVSAP